MTVSCTIVAAALYLAHPAVGWVLARGAEDLIVASSSIPYLADLSWTGTSARLESYFLPRRVVLSAPRLWLTLAVPLGFALALPGPRRTAYWRRAGAVLLASLGVSALLLAVIADGSLLRRLAAQGLVLHGPWRELLVPAQSRVAWETAAVVYPFVACIWLAGRAGVRPLGALFPQSPRRSTRPSAWRFGLAAALLGVLALDRVAQSRLAEVGAWPELRLYRALEARNADLGPYLLRRARAQEAAGRYREALRSFQFAARYPQHAGAALEGKRRIQASLRSGR